MFILPWHVYTIYKLLIYLKLLFLFQGIIWSFGLNRNIQVLNLTDDNRKLIMYACAHVGVLYDFENNRQYTLQRHVSVINKLNLSYLIYLTRIADNQWIWAVFLKVHTWIHNLKQYNGYYKYQNDKTIIFKRRRHSHAPSCTLNYKQYFQIGSTDMLEIYWGETMGEQK